MSVRKLIVAVKVAETADLFQFDSEETVSMLREAAGGAACEDEWGEPVGRIVGTARTDFLRVSGFPNMIAFRPAILAETNLELYLESGEFLPVQTPGGPLILWHLLLNASLNIVDKASIDPDGVVRSPRFVSHRLPGDCSVFTAPEFRHSRLFIQVHPSELTSDLGGLPENDRPPEGMRPENWRSLLQEAKWLGWTGLEFEVVWRDQS